MYLYESLTFTGEFGTSFDTVPSITYRSTESCRPKAISFSVLFNKTQWVCQFSDTFSDRQTNTKITPKFIGWSKKSDYAPVGKNIHSLCDGWPDCHDGFIGFKGDVYTEQIHSLIHSRCLFHGTVFSHQLSCNSSQWKYSFTRGKLIKYLGVSLIYYFPLIKLFHGFFFLKARC